MAAIKKIAVLPGDGIGPEVMVQVRRVVDWFDQRRHVRNTGPGKASPVHPRPGWIWPARNRL